jgi:hypothetical protein
VNYYFNLGVITHQVPLYYCPSRRGPETQPPLSIWGDNHNHPRLKAQKDGSVILSPNNPGALGDYACNIGTNGTDSLGSDGPFQVGMLEGGVRIAQITDGVSNTLYIGEKHIPAGMFGMGGWDSSIYNGSTYSALRSAGLLYPLAVSVHDMGWKFGSAHPGVCQFVFGDGSVHALSNNIDPLTLELLANIADGQTVPAY